MSDLLLIAALGLCVFGACALLGFSILTAVLIGVGFAGALLFAIRLVES